MAEAEMNHETPSTLTRNSAVTFAHARPVVSAQPSVSNDYETSGNLALKPDTNVITFPRLVEPAKPEPTLFKELKKSKKAKPKGKRTAFKENTGSLPKSWFPAKVKGATGWFDPVANGQGWVIRFRDTKPLTEDSNEKSFQFPRISAETYLTLKGMKTDAERKQYLRDYVRGNLINAVKRGNDRARAVAARLALKS